ncbi:hypothetical protein HWQ46_23840 [Shewanella sp. D64]|uniref:hypothetical protein n=1 Tax=unclassified Shewanella TaxID=196818 RepID=UPI0022BA509B|nr:MULTISPECIES: hypothetical protein [unclassified Shewanella]MEC4728559.1 hypothetical protein [Shewanella sp. D64]MEC4740563.1 hypothetical protein [Shewanella sp. E94]WBJ94244.1 hypothetical protein HWQ47_20480 [Shewanella sp. MTB7]
MNTTKQIELMPDSFGEQISNLQLRIKSLESELIRAKHQLSNSSHCETIALSEDEIKMIYAQF